MPSLTDTLQRISDTSAQIEYLSSLNARPAGPFVQQYLYLQSTNSAGVFDLIRDAADSEVRLFKFIGETEPTAAGGGNKRVEKREGVLVTPLKDYKKERAKGMDDVDVMLRTAAKLIDDYRPMPRLRAHIGNLMNTHTQQLEYIAALEAQIAEAQNPTAPAKKARISLPASAKPVLSVDDAIKAEEEAIRALEASLQPLREASAPPPEPEQNILSTPVSATPARAPLSPVQHNTISAQARAALRQSQLAQTPARPMPNVTNSLVTGMTPHRSARKPIDRFSPLKLLQTPRSVARPSSLRYAVDEEEGPRTIFARRSSARTPSGQLLIDESGEDETMAAVEDEVYEEEEAEGEAPEDEEAEEVYEEEIEEPESAPDSSVRDVNIGVDSIHSVISKIWATTPEMMAQGVPDGMTVGQDPAETIEHIHRLAQSDPAPPPSPSDSSSVAIAAASKAPPVNTQTILIAQLLLSVLRTISPTEPRGGVRMADTKERLIGIAQVRGWDGADPAVTKAIYAAVGRKVVMIDRRDGAGGTVRIAE